MTSDSRMLNSINTSDSNGVDSITFGEMAKAMSKGLVRLQYPMI
jgi:hypothetical protein